MITQKITDIQIEALYKFTRNHFVVQYDVQTELVDHLANDIEQLWKEQPHLAFDQAKDLSFKKFGVFGFMEVVEAKVAAMRKKYWQLIRRFMKEFLQWPQALSTICLFLFINVVLSQEGYQKTSLLILSGLVITGVFIQLFRLRNSQKKRLKSKNKQWLLEEMVLNTGGIAGFSYLPFQFIIQFGGEGNYGGMATLLLSLFLSVYILLLYTVVFVIPSKMTELLEEQYPEYKMMG